MRFWLRTGAAFLVLPAALACDDDPSPSRADAAQPPSDAAARDAAAATVDGSRRDAALADATAPPDARAIPDASDQPVDVCPAGAFCGARAFATWPMPTPAGARLPNGARYEVSETVVRDAVTGLAWQRTHFGKRAWPDALAACAALELAGTRDWRLPARIELVSLVDDEQSPSIDRTAFPDTPADYFWTASRTSFSANNAYSVYFGAGLTDTGGVDAPSAFVRCVRGPSPSAPRYEVGAETVSDQATGLTWQRAATTNVATREAALASCVEPWRLPTANELQSLVDESRTAPAIDVEAFPNTPSNPFWTLSNHRVLFDRGKSEESVFATGVVRCVRNRR